MTKRREKHRVRGDITVRRATKDDVPDILRLLAMGAKEQFQVDSLPEHMVREIASGYGSYYMGFVGGNLVGVCALDPKHRVAWKTPAGSVVVRDDVPYLKNIFILPKHRRGGVSGALLERALEDARGSGIPEVYEPAESEADFEDRLRRGFEVCGSCVSCPKGPKCGGKLMKKDLMRQRP